MSCDKITINGVEYEKVRNNAKRDGMEFCIVRCKDAGVHCGYVKDVDRDTNTVDLVGSRRMWRWHGRTLSGVALEGVDDPSKCKFGDVLPKILLHGWCEIIPCTDDAQESLYGVTVWVND